MCLGKAEKQNCTCFSLNEELLSQSCFYLSLPTLPIVVLRLESVKEAEIGITWGEAERENLVGLHKLCFFWKSRLEHNNIGSCFHLCYLLHL